MYVNAVLGERQSMKNLVLGQLPPPDFCPPYLCPRTFDPLEQPPPGRLPPPPRTSANLGHLPPRLLSP